MYLLGATIHPTTTSLAFFKIYNSFSTLFGFHDFFFFFFEESYRISHILDMFVSSRLDSGSHSLACVCAVGIVPRQEVLNVRLSHC